MPYIDVAIRQALGLVVNSPSPEDITAAAAAKGLIWDGQQLTQQPPAAPAKPSKTPASKPPAADA